jgi:hypothetical protein
MFDVTLLGESRAELVARLDAADTFARWSEIVPELASDPAISSVADVFAALAPGAPAVRWDILLWSLLRLAAPDGGDQDDAVLAVLHTVAGGASRLANRFDDGLVFGELTIQIRTYPWRTRRRAVAANLLRDTEHALCHETSPAWMRTREHAQRVTEIPVDVTPGVNGASSELDRPAASDAEDDLDLVDLLLWAERTGVVDGRSLSMLVEYHYGRDATGAGHEHVAEVFGVNVRTSKRRVAAALEALRAAVPEYLAS